MTLNGLKKIVATFFCGGGGGGVDALFGLYCIYQNSQFTLITKMKFYMKIVGIQHNLGQAQVAPFRVLGVEKRFVCIVQTGGC